MLRVLHVFSTAHVALARRHGSSASQAAIIAVDRKYKQKLTLHTAEPRLRDHVAPGHAHVVSGHAHVSAEDSRPLVVMIGWLLSKQKHLKRYADLLYNPWGLDSISILPTVEHVLRPQHARDAASALVELLTHDAFASRPLIVHGFSVGGFVWGCTMLELRRLGLALPNLKGIIFDSPVDVEGIPIGVSAAMFNNKIARGLSAAAIHAVMQMNRPAMALYKAASNITKENPTKAPIHMLYSHFDPITNSNTLEEAMEQWRSSGTEVTATIFDDSEHVMHMRRYFADYQTALHDFLAPKLGFDIQAPTSSA